MSDKLSKNIAQNEKWKGVGNDPKKFRLKSIKSSKTNSDNNLIETSGRKGFSRD